jgi:hypothetical protein
VRKRELIDILLKAAEISGRSEFVIIGSQAIHGTLPDANVEVTLRSNDVDTYPSDGYGMTNLIYEELMLHLGQDSDYHVASNAYIEAVPANLARFPEGWRDRTIREVVGTVASAGESREVVAIFPEIHDLTVSRLAIRREKDLEFLAGVIDLGLIDQVTLRDRYLEAPRVTKERLSEGLKDIDQAFARNTSGRSARDI